MDKKTYAGKIKNTAAQYVGALFGTEKSVKGEKTVGGDLRCGTTKKSSK